MLRARASTAMIFTALLAGGCHARVEEPVGYVEVTSAPLNVEAYPTVIYLGRPTYYVDGRWIYRDGGQWLAYRREPPELYRMRPYVQQAPPAYRPQPVYPQVPPTYPPPAVRVE